VETTTRANGMHALRHHYASVLLDAGARIKAVSEYLGHADAGFTLRTYPHLMPSSGERTRRAVDEAFACCISGTSGSRRSRIHALTCVECAYSKVFTMNCAAWVT
jgi:Phage integrase family